MKDGHDRNLHFGAFIHSLSDAALGRLLKEYVRESNHQGWDGFSPRDMSGVRNMMADMTLYHAARTEDNKEAFSGETKLKTPACVFDFDAGTPRRIHIGDNQLSLIAASLEYAIKFGAKCMSVPPAAEEGDMLIRMIDDAKREPDSSVTFGFCL